MPYKKLILLCFSFLFLVWVIPAFAAPPSSIPQIDFNAQKICGFKIGSEVVVSRITNIVPSTTYAWWWDGDWGASGSTKSNAGGSDFSITILKDKTQSGGDRKFCIDFEGSRRGWGENKGNCISLYFTKDALDPSKTPCSVSSVNNPSSAATPTGDGGTGTLTPTSTPTPKCTSDQIPTAIGCVRTKPTEFIQDVSKLLTGMGGGIAILLMIAGAFRMITSAGNPDAVKAGSEQFTSAIIGLLFIIFAVLLLKVIGVDIINIPGFVLK